MAGPFGGIASMFRNTQQVAAVPAVPGNGNNSQPPGNNQPTGKPGSSMEPNNGNNNNPGDPNAQPGNTGANNSPLDAFAGLWKNDPKAVDPNADPFAAPLFNMDPTKVREAAGNIDFLSQVPQELMAKAMSGQDPQAFMQVINSVAQNALATSLQLGTATMEQAGTRIGQRFNSALPGRMKSFQVQNMASKNPVLSHPAVQPVLQSVREQIQRQNPDLSPQQIQEMAENYFTHMMSEANKGGGGEGGGGGNANDPNAQENFNWMNWAGSGQQAQ